MIAGLGGDGGGSQLESGGGGGDVGRGGGDVGGYGSGGHGGGERIGWHGLSQESHIVQATWSLSTAVIAEVAKETFDCERKRNRERKRTL